MNVSLQKLADLAGSSLIGKSGNSLQRSVAELLPVKYIGSFDVEPLEAEDGSIYINTTLYEKYIRCDGKWLMIGESGSTVSPSVVNCRNCGAGLRSNICDYCQTKYS